MLKNYASFDVMRYVGSRRIKNIFLIGCRRQPQTKYEMNEITNDEFFDCECKHNYIHKKTDRLKCPKCKQTEDNMPDSFQNEIDSGKCFFLDFETWISQLASKIDVEKEKLDIESYREFYNDGQSVEEVFERELEYSA